jgi:glucose-1-phosphate cytidylyltransferase
MIAAPKVVILAGGRGSRLAEETDTKPKPMVEIGDYPIIWHIMKIYSHFGFNEFIICAGYKGYLIKEYFANYRIHMSDATFDLEKHETIFHSAKAEPWKVTVVDTGAETMTGGRILRVRQYLGEADFMLTYGDGLANVDIRAILDAHRKANRLATVTAVRSPSRFGALELAGDRVKGFFEKLPGHGSWINGGFFVMNHGIFDHIADDATVLEHEPLSKLASNGQLTAYVHDGYWQAMDTLRDRRQLEELWASGRAPWKIW